MKFAESFLEEIPLFLYNKVIKKKRETTKEDEIL